KRLDASRLMKATVHENWNGWITPDGDEDRYFSDVEHMLDHYHSQIVPAWVFITKEIPFQFDIWEALESYLEDDHHEDALDHLVACDDLEKAFDAWKAKQTLTSYMSDYSGIVVIDRDRYEAE